MKQPWENLETTVGSRGPTGAGRRKHGVHRVCPPKSKEKNIIQQAAQEKDSLPNSSGRICTKYGEKVITTQEF